MKFQRMVLMEALDHQRKISIWILLKQIQNFVWVFTTMLLIAIRLLMEKNVFKLKAYNKNINFPSQFCLGSISNEFSATGSREVSLDGNMHDFSVDYDSIDKSDILNIHKYFMIKNNIK